MGFLDTLENSLKSLEGADERSGGQDRLRNREAERSTALAAAPHAERLKSGPFTSRLLEHAAAAGHSARTKIYVSWLGTTLRLEARGRRLELRPTPEGVVAVVLEGVAEVSTSPVDLDGDPDQLVRDLLARAA